MITKFLISYAIRIGRTRTSLFATAMETENDQTDHGDGRFIEFADHVRKAEAAWEKAESIPSVKSATVEGVRRFSVVYAYSCIASGKTLSYGTHFSWDPERACYVESRPRPLLVEQSLRSSGGDVDVEILRQKNEAGQEIDVLNVFGKEWRLGKKSIDLGNKNLHGGVYYDATFGGIAVSGDLTRAAFIAEAKEVKGSSFFKAEGADRAVRGQEFLYRDDFGEQFEGKRSPTIVQLDLETYLLKIQKGLPENWCPGQLVYHPDGTSLIGSAYILGPRRLGIWACSNRPRIIFLLDESGAYKVLSQEENVSAESPRVSSDGKFLYWMERDLSSDGIEYGPHQACRRLVRRRLDIADGDIETIVPVKHDASATDSHRVFRGLFIGELPKRPFSADGRFMVVNTICGDSKVALIINVETKEVEIVGSPDCYPSASVLDVHLDFVVAEGSSPNRAPVVMCAAIDTSSFKSLKERLTLLIAQKSSNLKLALEYKIFHHRFKHKLDCFGTAIMAMPVMPTDRVPAGVPLIVFLHGGPNSSYQTCFNKQVFFFVQLGYSVLMVNYIGSTGHGQVGIDALAGFVGVLDVQDCWDIIYSCIEAEKRIDKEEIYLYGGSHGGFLALHLAGRLIGRHPFKGVAVRNPVTNRSTKAAATDIPDIESNYADLSYDYLPLKTDAMRKLYEISPIALVENIKAPVCLFLGKRDRRVPPSQGREFYHALKALGRKVRMYEYEDNHSLAKVTTAANAMVNAALFFFEIRNSML